MVHRKCLISRAQQSADRWQSRYDEKSQEVTKLEAGLSLVKSAMSRLEKEKRMLLTRLNDMKSKYTIYTKNYANMHLYYYESYFQFFG